MAPRTLTIMIFIISAAVFLQKCQGQPTLMCDNFCSNNENVTCTCEDAGNPSNMTVWKLVDLSTSCSITLNQTGACNATSDTCATIPGIIAINESPMMAGATCDSSTLHIINSSRMEGLQIDCMSPDGTSYGGIGFSRNPPSTPTVSLCAVSSTEGFLVVNPATDGVSGVPSSYNVTISTGGETIIETLRALSNGTATYNFTYSGSGVPSVIATAINCAGNATSYGTNTFPPCNGPATPTSLPSASTSTSSTAMRNGPATTTSLPSASTSTPSFTTNTGAVAVGTVISIAVGVSVSVIFVVSLVVASVLCCLLRRSCKGKPRSQASPSPECKEMITDEKKEDPLEMCAT